jgi:hypothetical protein
MYYYSLQIKMGFKPPPQKKLIGPGVWVAGNEKQNKKCGNLVALLYGR